MDIFLLYAQCVVEGNQFQLMDCIVDHKKDDTQYQSQTNTSQCVGEDNKNAQQEGGCYASSGRINPCHDSS